MEGVISACICLTAFDSDEETFLTQNSFSQDFFSREFNFTDIFGELLVGKREDTIPVDNVCWGNEKEMQKRH